MTRARRAVVVSGSKPRHVVRSVARPRTRRPGTIGRVRRRWAARLQCVMRPIRGLSRRMYCLTKLRRRTQPWRQMPLRVNRGSLRRTRRNPSRSASAASLKLRCRRRRVFRCARWVSPPDCAAAVSEEAQPVAWREVDSEIGRRRFDTRYSATWLALSGLFVPIERALGPARRPLLRELASALRPDQAAESGPESTRVASGTAHQAIPLPVFAEGMDSLLRA